MGTAIPIDKVRKTTTKSYFCNDPKMFEEGKISVYVLRLENDCWYVGVADDLQWRLKNHFSGGGSKWTKKHPPIECVFSDVAALTSENDLTLILMKKYGWRNVRGGSWSSPRMEMPPVPLRISDGDFWVFN